MAQRASVVVLLVALVSPACLRSGNGERPAAVAAERVDPVVIAPDGIRAGGTLPIAAVFPTIGRYAVSGLQSLQGARDQTGGVGKNQSVSVGDNHSLTVGKDGSVSRYPILDVAKVTMQ